MSNIIIIPARLESTRLPQKLLLSETGKSVLQHTYEQAFKSRLADNIIIAVDCDRLYYEAVRFCPFTYLTGPAESGSDRVAEVVRSRCFSGDDVIVNVQADEPEVDPVHIDLLFEHMLSCDDKAATLAIASADIHDASVVKVVFDIDHYALYFSRWAIPFGLRSGEFGFRHIGVYAFRADFLYHINSLHKSHLEIVEKLEQLRILENGYKLRVLLVEDSQVGIDTRADYDAFVARWNNQLTT